MKVVMIGTGYVGLVSGACFAEMGNIVHCVDKDIALIERLKSGSLPIYEPDLEKLVSHNVEQGRLYFATKLEDAVPDADIVFIAVGTPRGREDGKANLSYVFQAAEEIALVLSGGTVVATKSTVPIGTGRRIEKIFREKNPNTKVGIAVVPEFLREGYAVNDFLNPYRIIVGSDSEYACSILRELHRPLLKSDRECLVETSFETAELIKYASNAFLAVKISYINEIANLCEKVGADVEEVAHGMGLDARINRWGLSAGPGFGGSCFPKDTLALINAAAEYKSPVRIVEAAVAANNARKATLFSRIRDGLGGELQGCVIAILGLTFKSNTDDLRDSPSMELIPRLQENGAVIKAYDPQGMEEAKTLIENVEWCNSIYTAADGADAAVIMTEWLEFGSNSLDLMRLRDHLKNPLLIDFRNLHTPDSVGTSGIHYISVGRAPGRIT